MSLIAVLISLFVESFWQGVEQWRRFGWFERYAEAFYQKLEGQDFREGPIGALLIVVPVIFAVWLVEAMLAEVWIGFAYLFGVVILIYCVGPRDLNRQVQQYLAAVQHGDQEGANQLASDILGESVDEDTPLDTAERLREAILTQIVDRLLGVFFWYVLLGPVGVVLFRTAALLQQQTRGETSGFAKAADDLYQILYWLPARLCVIGYALAGNFVDTMSYWNSPADLWQRDSKELLLASGVGSLRQDMRFSTDKWLEEQDTSIGVAHAFALIKRTLIFWVVALALLTLFGWLI